MQPTNFSAYMISSWLYAFFNCNRFGSTTGWPWVICYMLYVVCDIACYRHDLAKIIRWRFVATSLQLASSSFFRFFWDLHGACYYLSVDGNTDSDSDSIWHTHWDSHVLQRRRRRLQLRLSDRRGERIYNK